MQRYCAALNKVQMLDGNGLAACQKISYSVAMVVQVVYGTKL